jgi:hypothetical protein
MLHSLYRTDLLDIRCLLYLAPSSTGRIDEFWTGAGNYRIGPVSKKITDDSTGLTGRATGLWVKVRVEAKVRIRVRVYVRV